MFGNILVFILIGAALWYTGKNIWGVLKGEEDCSSSCNDTSACASCAELTRKKLVDEAKPSEPPKEL